jgi:primosomal protein N' (replication factor Y)
MCHHCGYNASSPRACPRCGVENALVACGPGVERVAEEVASLFPGARSAIMASDTVGGPLAAEELVRQVRDHELDLLIGTQIMAKGHHFPLLTLVGVIDADLGLAGGDLRAAERTYQLLHQVSGRAGRAERPGRVLLQTYVPDHPVIAALLSGDRDRFLAVESDMRREYGMPPFGRLVALVVSGFDPDAVEHVAAALGRAAPAGEGIEVFGPAPAPFALLRGRHRRRLLLKARKDVAVQPRLHEWLLRIKVPHGVRIQVDVDPYSFL